MKAEKLALLTLLMLPILLTYVVLRYQIDPFDSSTVMMGQLISQLGSVSASSVYVHASTQLGTNVLGWTWAGDTEVLLSSLYGSGLTLAMLHLITGGPLVALSYAPVSYVVIILGLFLCSKLIWKMVRTGSILLPSVFVFIASASIYAELSTDLVGRFYGMEYHGENIAFVVIFFFVFLKGITENRVKSYVPVLLVVFSAMVITHYTEPLLIVGGLATYLLVLWVSNRMGAQNGQQIKDLIYLFVPLCVLDSIQSYYYVVLGGINFGLVDQRLVEYFSGGVAQVSFGHISSGSAFLAYQAILEKAYAGSMAGLVVAMVAVYYSQRKFREGLGHASGRYFLFVTIVGASLTYSIAYFANYGGRSFGFQYSWLLQLLLVPAIVAIARVDSKKKGHMFVVLIFVLILLVSLNAMTSSLTLYGESSQGPFTSTLYTESLQVLPFVAGHVGNQYLIGASVGVSSSIYRQLVNYPLSDTSKIVPIPLSGYFSIYGSGGTSELYRSMRSAIGLFLLTRYELNDGLYGDVSSSYGVSQYMSSGQLSNLTELLDSRTNIVYQSNACLLYSFNGGEQPK